MDTVGRNYMIITSESERVNSFIDETDEEDEEQPRRRRRLAERAADGDMQDEDEVQGINTLLKIIFSYN